jgi:glutamyl-tRNA reductase
MRLTALGVNHLSAPLDVRERLSVPAQEQNGLLHALCELPEVQGAMLLSTCNRTEIYLAQSKLSDAADDQRALAHYLQSRGASSELLPYFYRHEQAQAVRHVFRVATGLDSMVLGEPQILGQLKAAYASAKSAHTLAPSLDRLLQHSFFVAKQARTDTGLGQNPVSVASSAVKLCKQVYDDFDRRTALIIGAGETATLIAKHLQSQGVRRLIVINRTFSRAQALAAEVGGQAVLFAQLAQHLADADLIITATAATQPIISKRMLEAATRSRRRRTLLLIDLSVPRNVEASARELSDVFLYGVDDLRAVADAGLQAREHSAGLAEAVINGHVDGFMRWLQARESFEPVIALRERAFAQRDAALDAAKRQLQAGTPAAELLEKLAHQLTNQLLHAPTLALREAAGNDEQIALLKQALKLD